MLPDDRLRELLQRAEDQTRSEPEFMDGLFDDLLTRRRRRVVRFGPWVLPRPVAYGALVPLAVVVAVAGFLGVTSPSSPSTGVGAVSPSPTASSSPNPVASPAGSASKGPVALVDAESATFRYVAPNGWDTFDASSPELPGIVTDLRLEQADPGNDWTAADITASAIEFLADNGEGVVGEGAVAIDPSSNGVDGALVISVGEFGSMTPEFAGTQLSQNMGAATAAGDVSEPLTREVGLGEATSVSGVYPSGHVMHRAYIPIGDYELLGIDFVTKLGRDESAPLFEAILNSIERKGVSPSPSSAACSVELDGVSHPPVPEGPHTTVLFNGIGFKPGSQVGATDVGPTGTHPIDVTAPEQVQVRADGTFGPLDLTYSGPEEVGSHSITFSDGVCEATLEFTVDG